MLLDTRTRMKVTANPLMLSMVISTYEMRTTGAGAAVIGATGVGSGGNSGNGSSIDSMPQTVAALYGKAVDAILHRAGADLMLAARRLLQATLFEAHASQQRVIELHHLEAAALSLADAPKLETIRSEWPTFDGPPSAGQVVRLRTGGACGVAQALGTAFKVHLPDGSLTPLLTAADLISSGLEEGDFQGRRRDAVRAALGSFAGNKMRQTMAFVVDRVQQDSFPLLSLLQTQPLQLQSSHLSFQVRPLYGEYELTRVLMEALTGVMAPVRSTLWRCRCATVRHCLLGLSRGDGLRGGPMH